MNNKKGISLIVLVITILVMIILAGVVIVSLQNDNPINKAKYAKMVDSVQSVRSAISQYAVTSQANSEGNQTSSIDIILAQKDERGTVAKTSVKKDLGDVSSNPVGYLIVKEDYKIDGVNDTVNGKTVKDLLGVDPSQVSSYGYFVVNRTTGASEFVLTDKNIKGTNTLPDGIVEE